MVPVVLTYIAAGCHTLAQPKPGLSNIGDTGHHVITATPLVCTTICR